MKRSLLESESLLTTTVLFVGVVSLKLVAGQSDLRCDSVVGYYHGTFQDPNHNNAFNAAFRFSAYFDSTNVYVNLTHVDDSYDTCDLSLHVHTIDTKFYAVCLKRELCSISIDKATPYIDIHVHNDCAGDFHYSIANLPFAGMFTLTNAVEQCSNQQITAQDSDHSTFTYCVCCHLYVPLDGVCPKSEWDPILTTSTRPTTSVTTEASTSTTGSTTTIPYVKYPFGIDCRKQSTRLDEIFCNRTWASRTNEKGSAEDIYVATESKNAFSIATAQDATLYELSVIYSRLSRIHGFTEKDYALIYDLYDKILGCPRETFEAANEQDAKTTIRFLDSTERLMVLASSDFNWLWGRNVGIKRIQTPKCQENGDGGLADFGNDFDSNLWPNYIVGIEIPKAVLCASKSPFFYAIYRHSNLFVSTAGANLFARFDEHDKFQSDNPCKVRDLQATKHVLDATLITKSASEQQPKTMAILRFRRDNIQTGLHSELTGTWWNREDSHWSRTQRCPVKLIGHYYVAECNHLSDFTLLIHRRDADPALCDLFLSIVTLLFSSISIGLLCLLNIIYIINYFALLYYKWAVELIKSRPLLQANIDLSAFVHNSLFICFYFTFTFFNTQFQAGNNAKCQLVAGVNYWILMSIVLLTFFKAWKHLKEFVSLAIIDHILSYLTDSIVIVVTSLIIPLGACLLITLTDPNFYNRRDYFCWIDPTHILWGILFPMSLMIGNGILCLIVIALRILANNPSMRRISALFGFTVLSRGDQKTVVDDAVKIFAFQFLLGIPWAIQYLTLFTVNVTFWNFVFTLFVSGHGAILFAVFCYNQWLKRTAYQSASTSEDQELEVISSNPAHNLSLMEYAEE